MNAAAIIAAKQNRCIGALRDGGAVDAENALTLADAGISDSRIFRSLLRRGVIRTVGGDRYYLDAEAAERFLAARRRTMLIVVAAALIIVLLLLAVR